MKVTLVACTTTASPIMGASLGPIADFMTLDEDATEAQDLIEFAGRACYQSWSKPNPKTRANADYLDNIIAQGHHSVLEHASVTFYIEGVSRSCTHELIRHRHLSFSELSQRFVNVEWAESIVPPALLDHSGVSLYEDSPVNIEDAFERAMFDAEGSYRAIFGALTANTGLTRKQAREAARAVMPNATETKIVVTGNHRAWRDMLTKRHTTHADAEIRELAGEILRQLRDVAPAVYADFPEEPLG